MSCLDVLSLSSYFCLVLVLVFVLMSSFFPTAQLECFSSEIFYRTFYLATITKLLSFLPLAHFDWKFFLCIISCYIDFFYHYALSWYQTRMIMTCRSQIGSISWMSQIAFFGFYSKNAASRNFRGFTWRRIVVVDTQRNVDPDSWLYDRIHSWNWLLR